MVFSIQYIYNPLAALYQFLFVFQCCCEKILSPKDGSTSYPVYSKEYIEMGGRYAGTVKSYDSTAAYATIFYPSGSGCSGRRSVKELKSPQLII